MNGGDVDNEPSTKRQALSESRLKIGTHNGTFHCDEALACYMLKCLPKYKVSQLSIIVGCSGNCLVF